MYRDEDRCDRYAHELEHNQRERNTIGFPEAWLLDAGKRALRQVGVERPNLVNVYLQVKDGFADVAAMAAANENFSLTCPVTALNVSALFKERNMDPVVLESFHHVRKHFPDPTSHALKRDIDQLDLAV